MSPLAALLIGWAITGLWPLVGKKGLTLFSGLLYSQAGLLISLLVLAPALARQGRWRRLVDPAIRRDLFLVGLLATTLPCFLLITALERTSAANAAIAAQVEVVYSALLCAWLLKERVSAAQAAASALVIAGTGIALARDLGTVHWKGDLIILLTPWTFQLSHIIAKRLPADLDACTIAGGRLGYGALAFLPFTAWALWRDPRWTWSAEASGVLLFQGVIMMAFTHVLWYVSIRGMDLSKATAIMLSYPALTLLYSRLLGAEPIGPHQWAGLCVTLAGAWWLTWLAAQARAPEPAPPPVAAREPAAA